MNRDISYFVLLPDIHKERFLDLAQKNGLSKNAFAFASKREELDQLALTYGTFPFLISFSTSVIVPSEYLNKPGQIAINIHAASPDYPGRDPHHYAVYEGAVEYGATMHYMTDKVDAGDIIAVEIFQIDANITPRKLMLQAEDCAWILIEKLLFWIHQGIPLPQSDRVWSSVKRSRKDFIRFCKIEPNMEKTEIDRRIRAFHVDGFSNLYTEIHGIKFYYKDPFIKE